MAKALGYFGGVLAFVGLIWGTVIREMGLTMAVIGIIIMVVTMIIFEEE